MARNRFEQVDEVQPDAITLGLWRRDGEACGTVTWPAIPDAPQTSPMVSDLMSAKDAFRAAIRLANEIKAAVVVVDPDELWWSEWGDLFRAV
jgi:hypothetical protein